jgi:hypothetical protein
MLRPMRNAIVSIVRSAAVLAVFSCCVACGGSDSKTLGKYSEECTANDDCEQGLMCINRLCTLSCNASNSVCQARDPKSSCVAGVCSNLCSDRRDCPDGLTCVMSVAGNTCGPQ